MYRSVEEDETQTDGSGEWESSWLGVVWESQREREGEGGRRGGGVSGSVLLQDQGLQLIGRAEQEGGRLAVAGDELPHGRDLCWAELCRGPATYDTSTPPVTV